MYDIQKMMRFAKKFWIFSTSISEAFAASLTAFTYFQNKIPDFYRSETTSTDV